MEFRNLTDEEFIRLHENTDDNTLREAVERLADAHGLPRDDSEHHYVGDYDE